MQTLTTELDLQQIFVEKVACSRCDKQFHEECAYTFERETLLATVIYSNNCHFIAVLNVND